MPRNPLLTDRAMNRTTRAYYRALSGGGPPGKVEKQVPGTIQERADGRICGSVATLRL
jgi:hypothetical protein